MAITDHCLSPDVSINTLYLHYEQSILPLRGRNGEKNTTANFALLVRRTNTTSTTRKSYARLNRRGKTVEKKKDRGGGKRRGEESGEPKGVRQQQQPPPFSTTPDELPLHYPSTNTGERTSWWKNGRGKGGTKKGLAFGGNDLRRQERRGAVQSIPFWQTPAVPPFAAGVFPGGYLGHDNLEEAPEERESECAGMIKGCCCWCNPKGVLELLAMRNV
ncbi:hypothetical protein CDAR_490001 [Caerostris darwini]|uniref:Uncharacterized protein n=1 Tax=Caerostris darwini TaxID=1538125 RepID=A0AAV4TN23_9ARAC|nr:hypothetical protein CDAR_490001 [Caerostris darwini]